MKANYIHWRNTSQEMLWLVLILEYITLTFAFSSLYKTEGALSSGTMVSNFIIAINHNLT